MMKQILCVLRPNCEAILAKSLRRSLSLSKCAASLQLFFAPKKADGSTAEGAFALLPLEANVPSAPLRCAPAIRGFNLASTRL